MGLESLDLMGISAALREFNTDFWVQLAATLVKFGVLVGLLLQVPPIMVWVERRAPAFMQRRKGPNRVGPFKWRMYGLLQSFADAVS